MIEWTLLVLVVLLVAAALQDVLSMRISNLFPIAIMLLFVAWVAIVGVPDNLWQNIVHFVIALAGGMILFALGWFGGGDAKLYASSALWFSLSNAISLLFFVSISGLVLLVLMLVIGRIRKARAVGRSDDTGDQKPTRMKLPYGVAISTGVIAVLFLQGVNPAPEQPFDPTSIPLPDDLQNLAR